MKNVVKGKGLIGAYRIPLDNVPPLRGWAIRYISGMEGEEEVEPGFYMAYWYPDSPKVRHLPLNEICTEFSRTKLRRYMFMTS